MAAREQTETAGIRTNRIEKKDHFEVSMAHWRHSVMVPVGPTEVMNTFGHRKQEVLAKQIFDNLVDTVIVEETMVHCWIVSIER